MGWGGVGGLAIFVLAINIITEVRSKFGHKHGPPSRTLEVIGPKRTLEAIPVFLTKPVAIRDFPVGS